ncbi:GntR family transcriptional regulator [Inquilinus ginsengisoli]|uniref:GntR family transcriptional regulator n=1 Tax=Inquilinus ginsengisoli TaxID=363840 RepID=UPI003D229311
MQTLGRAIVAGRYAADRPLPTETELAAEYAVGRNAMREAIKVLAGKGLIRTRPALRLPHPAARGMVDPRPRRAGLASARAGRHRSLPGRDLRAARDRRAAGGRAGGPARHG